ncbi:MAG: hypothetical protein H7Y13_02505 [Sphingobacteriaceae bacterium]|nr:hypothetical protein [Sphingobacteriaceae bacterium]
MIQKLFTTVLLALCISAGMGQTTKTSHRSLNRKLTIEPAIGMSLFGNDGLRFSTIIQRNTEKKLSFISHTSLSPGLMTFVREDVKQNYSYSLAQKIGIGASFYTKKMVNSYSFIAGLKYSAYSGTLQNDEIPETITTKTSSVSSEYGMMYNLKLGKGKCFFSTRVYIPLKDGIYGLGEDSSFEFGLGIRVKSKP